MDNNENSVLITGAASGIGLEFAKLFSLRGDTIILSGRDMLKLEATKEQLGAVSSKIHLLQADLAEKDGAVDLYNQCKNNSFDVNILINNAGVGLYGEHTALNANEVASMITLNVTSLTTLCHLFGKDMKERKHGYILNVASTAAYQPVPYFSAYAATKSYVLNFSEALSKELEDYNVVVSCLSPGHTETNFFASAGIGNNNDGFFSRKNRVNANKVAAHGIDILFKKRISSIPGFKNNVIAWSNRLVPRKTGVKITKGLTSKP